MKALVALVAICGRLAIAQPMPANITLKAIFTDEKERDQREKILELVLAMGLKPGSTVGDLGTGYGYYAARFAKVVGPNGRIYAEEIDKPLLNKVRQRMASQNITNITLVLGAPDDPKFPTGTLDAVIIADVYHELDHPDAILNHVKKALKPGGKVLIIDYLKPALLERSRAEQAREHNIAPRLIESDLVTSGFTIGSVIDSYATGYDGIPMFYILATAK